MLAVFIINPLFLFAVLLFKILFSLTGNPDVAAMPSFILGFGIMVGLPTVMMMEAINIGRGFFALSYLEVSLISLILVLYISRLMTRQRIVLSSKDS